MESINIPPTSPETKNISYKISRQDNFTPASQRDTVSGQVRPFGAMTILVIFIFSISVIIHSIKLVTGLPYFIFMTLFPLHAISLLFYLATIITSATTVIALFRRQKAAIHAARFTLWVFLATSVINALAIIEEETAYGNGLSASTIQNLSTYGVITLIVSIILYLAIFGATSYIIRNSEQIKKDLIK